MLNASDYEKSLPRKRVAAGVLFFDELHRVLLVDPIYKAPWEIPGGAVEADESPRAGASREAKEELGLSVHVGPLLGVDWTAPRPDRTEGIVMIFDGGTLSPEEIKSIRLQPEELRSYEFTSETEVDTRLIPLLSRRVRACIKARQQKETIYMENGHVTY